MKVITETRRTWWRLLQKHVVPNGRLLQKHVVPDEVDEGYTETRRTCEGYYRNTFTETRSVH